MKRVHLFVSGEVQGVGYRETVKKCAFGLNIFGWVMNLDDGRVEMIAEGENQHIEEFLNNVNIKKYPIYVEEVEIKEELYTGDFKSFKVVRDKDTQKEILSAISRGTIDIQEMKEILHAVRQDTAHIPEIRENTKTMLEKQDKMLEKQDKMLEKQDKMLEKQDKMLEKQDTTIHILEKVGEDTSEMKSTLSRIESDVKDTKYSLASFIDEKFRKQDGEIAEIKATLARMREPAMT